MEYLPITTLVVVALVLFVACEGPVGLEGSKGEQGIQGPKGEDGWGSSEIRD